MKRKRNLDLTEEDWSLKSIEQRDSKLLDQDVETARELLRTKGHKYRALFGDIRLVRRWLRKENYRYSFNEACIVLSPEAILNSERLRTYKNLKKLLLALRSPWAYAILWFYDGEIGMAKFGSLKYLKMAPNIMMSERGKLSIEIAEQFLLGEKQYCHQQQKTSYLLWFFQQDRSPGEIPKTVFTIIDELKSFLSGNEQKSTKLDIQEQNAIKSKLLYLKDMPVTYDVIRDNKLGIVLQDLIALKNTPSVSLLALSIRRYWAFCLFGKKDPDSQNQSTVQARCKGNRKYHEAEVLESYRDNTCMVKFSDSGVLQHTPCTAIRE